MKIEERARLHRALGDEMRLRIVDELILADRTPAELGESIGMRSNLLAHHLGVLDESGLLVRHTSEGDRRRRYVGLRRELLTQFDLGRDVRATSVLFVCTHNSARSKFAEAFMRERTGLVVQSAGTRPSAAVHPKAVSMAAGMGVEIDAEPPKPYDQVRGTPDLVISVCDRARERPLPFSAPSLHWSVPDPVKVDRVDAFRVAFTTIRDRVDQLVDALERGSHS